MSVLILLCSNKFCSFRKFMFSFIVLRPDFTHFHLRSFWYTLSLSHTHTHTHTHTRTHTHTHTHSYCLWPWEKKTYLHRLKLIDNPMCPCDEGAQSSEHLIYDCKILEFQRNNLKHQIKSREGTWPTNNSDLITKYSHAFSRFIKSVDFNKLQ